MHQPKRFWIHKYEVSQEYGGPEEGGWWYDLGTLVEDFVPLYFEDEDAVYEKCRELNGAEGKRREDEEQYGYTSVLSHMSTFYDYTVDETAYPPKHFPETRPHYE